MGLWKDIKIRQTTGKESAVKMVFRGRLSEVCFLHFSLHLRFLMRAIGRSAVNFQRTKF